MERVYDYLRATGRDDLVGLPEMALSYNIRGSEILKGSWELGNLTSIGWRRIGTCIYCDNFPKYKYTFRDESAPLLAAFILSYPAKDELFADMLAALLLLEKIEFAVDCNNNMAFNAKTNDIIYKLGALQGSFWQHFATVPAAYYSSGSGTAGWNVSGELIYPANAPHLRFPLTDATRWAIGTFNTAGGCGFRPVAELTQLYEIVTGLPATTVTPVTAQTAVTAATPAAVTAPTATVTIDGVTSNVTDTLMHGIHRETFAAHLAIYEAFSKSAPASDSTTGIVPEAPAALFDRLVRWINMYNDCIDADDHVNPIVIGRVYKHPRPQNATDAEQELARVLSTRVYGGAFKIPGFGAECAKILSKSCPDFDMTKLM